MNVKVVVYNTRTGRKENELVPRNLNVPNGFVLNGGNRKFIVLLDKESVTIAIGQHLNGGFYYHKDIKSLAERDFPDLRISGGGEIEFTLSDRGWLAKLHGQSGDFGVFDHIVFDSAVAQAIANAMEMTVHFVTERSITREPR